jgi:hypothetical protein
VWTRSGLASRSLLRPLFPDDESHISNLKLIHHTSCLLSEEIDEKLFLCYVATTRKRYKYYRWLTSFNDYESIVLWCVYFLIINRSPHRVHLFHYSPPPIIQVIDWVKIVFFTASKSKCSLFFYSLNSDKSAAFQWILSRKKSIEQFTALIFIMMMIVVETEFFVYIYSDSPVGYILVIYFVTEIPWVKEINKASFIECANITYMFLLCQLYEML